MRFATIAVLVLIPLLLAVQTVRSLLQRGELEQIEAVNRQMEDEIANLEKIVGEVGVMRDMQHTLERRLHAIEGIRAERSRVLDVLALVESSVPPGLGLTRLELADEAIRLAGTGEPGAVADLMDGLRSADCVADVTLTEAGSDRFDVRASLRPEEPCPAGAVGARDPFAATVPRPAAPRSPPLFRWPVREYRVVAIEAGGSALIEDPAGGAHAISEGSYLGAEKARVTVVTDDQVVLTYDEVVDPDTNKLRSHIVTLRIQAAILTE